MKKEIDGEKTYSMLMIYKDDIRRFCDLFKDNCSRMSILIRTDNYERRSCSDIDDIPPNEHINVVRIKGEDPDVLLLLTKKSAKLKIYDKQRISYGFVTDLDGILKSRIHYLSIVFSENVRISILLNYVMVVLLVYYLYGLNYLSIIAILFYGTVFTLIYFISRRIERLLKNRYRVRFRMTSTKSIPQIIRENKVKIIEIIVTILIALVTVVITTISQFYIKP